MAATVLLPARLVALGAEGLLLAEAGGIEAIGGDAQGHEILLDGVGAANAEAKVVFGGAALVAVAFDGCFDGRVGFQEVRGLGESGAGVRANVSLIVVEVGVLHFTQEEFVIRRPFGLLDWRRRCVYRDGRGGTSVASGASRRDCVSGGVGGRNLGGALGSDGANVRSDGELRGIGRVPAQGR